MRFAFTLILAAALSMGCATAHVSARPDVALERGAVELNHPAIISQTEMEPQVLGGYSPVPNEMLAQMMTGVVSPDIDQVPRWEQNGLYVIPKTLAAQFIAANKVTKMLGANATIDFASATITCTDSSAVTVTGAVAGDACSVGPPVTVNGAGTGLNSTFSCYVSAANTVLVRHCAAGTADDPASATFFVRVISSQ